MDKMTSNDEKFVYGGGLSNPDNSLESADFPGANGKNENFLYFKHKGKIRDILVHQSADTTDGYKAAVLEIFSKIFAHVSSEYVSGLNDVKRHIYVADEWTAKLGETSDITLEEKVFLNLMFFEDWKNIDQSPSKRHLEIVRAHIREHNETVYDTVEKVAAGLNPRTAQLGFENSPLMGKVKFTMDQARELSERELVEQLDKYVGAFNVSERQPDALVRDCSFAILKKNGLWDVKKSPYAELVRKFLEFPWEDEAFSARMGSLTAEELAYIEGFAGGNPSPPDLVIQWIDHQLIAFHTQKDGTQLRECNYLYYTASQCYAQVTKNKQDFTSLLNWVLVKSPNTGLIRFLTELYENGISGFNHFGELLNLNAFIEGYIPGDGLWTDDARYADMVLLNLHESVGALKGFEWLTRASEESPKPSVKVWLWAAKNADIADATPVSWWASMAED